MNALFVFIGILIFLMAINAIGRYNAKRGKKNASGRETRTKDMMDYNFPSQGAPLPALPAVSTEPVRSEGAIMLVRNKNFGGVAEAPKSLMATLNDMGGGDKKGPPPVSLRSGATMKSISGPVSTEPRKAGALMPELGRKAGQDGVTLFTAPVDYKVFKSSAVWQAFALQRNIKDIKHDFSSGDLLILFSVSDFPNGIFKISGVERGAKETVVKYRVDPLAMAEEAGAALRETYASVAVPRRSPPIRLQQVP